MPRTPHGVEIPENYNRLGRPPRPMRDTPEAREVLTSPHLQQRLRELQEHHPEVAHEMEVDLRQFYRALNNERALPGEYNGDDSLPHQPLPFTPRETHRPDREPGTPTYDAMRRAVENIEAASMTEALQERMGTDHRAAEPSTWERADPYYRPPSRDDAPPSLREQITAAASLDYPKE